MFKPLNLELNGVRLPEFKLPEKARKDFNISLDNNEDILHELARIGFKNKSERGLIPKDKIKEYGDRAKYELSCLKQTGFIDYILLVWDVCYYARSNNIALGPGRGSAAGSLINYLIGITDIDPIKYNLYFERFISLSRAQSTVVNGITYLTGSLPDIDLDFGDEDRQKVIHYLSEKYNGNFVKLCTVQTLSSKIVIKETFKIVKGANETDAKIVSSYVPSLFGKNYSLGKCYEEVSEFKKFADENQLVYSIANKLSDGIKSFGSHASAYLLTLENLNDIIPCQLGSADDTGENEVISSYDMYTAGDIAIKMDLLGVSSINLIHNIAKRVNKPVESIDINDYETIYKYLQNLSLPYDLFQISGDAAIRGLAKIKPKDINHLSGVLAICRPGALSFVDDYADYVNYGTYKSLHPIFDECLKETGGLCLYQEQLMAMVNKMGFSLKEADDIRRIVGKKKTEEIKEWEGKIHKRAEETKIPSGAADVLWPIALSSADYSFNKCIKSDCEVETPDGKKKLHELVEGDFVKGYNTKTSKDEFNKVKNIWKNKKTVYEVETEDGRKIQTSLEHKFLCEDMVMRPLKDIIKGEYKLCVEG
jgi:DNA polymerase-3 subunit alpha